MASQTIGGVKPPFDPIEGDFSFEDFISQNDGPMDGDPGFMQLSDGNTLQAQYDPRTGEIISFLIDPDGDGPGGMTLKIGGADGGPGAAIESLISQGMMSATDARNFVTNLPESARGDMNVNSNGTISGGGGSASPAGQGGGGSPVGGGGGNAGGGGGGNAVGSVDNPLQPAPVTTPGGPPPIGGDPGAATLDPNAPLAVNDPGARPLGQGAIASPDSLFDFLPDDPTLADVVGGVTRRQEQGLDAALQPVRDVFEESQTGGNQVAQRDLVSRMLADPLSFDEDTIRRLQGRASEDITGRANVLAENQRQRAASLGTGRDQGEVAANATLRQAASDQSSAENQIRMGARVQNQQDMRSAIQGGAAANQQDIGVRERMAGAGADILNRSQVNADAFLANALIAPQTGFGFGQNQQWPKATPSGR